MLEHPGESKIRSPFSDSCSAKEYAESRSSQQIQLVKLDNLSFSCVLYNFTFHINICIFKILT